MKELNVNSEKINIIRQVYVQNKTEILSLVEQIIEYKVEKILETKYKDEPLSRNHIKYKEEIVKYIIQDFGKFIENRGGNNYNLDSENLNFLNVETDVIADRQIIHEIDNLLNTAESIERKEYLLSRRRDFFTALLILTWISLISIWHYLSFFVDTPSLTTVLFTAMLLATIFWLIYSFASVLAETSKQYKKEKRAFEKIVKVIQEIIPYYLDKMTVLERANFEVKLARMNIYAPDSNL